MEILRCSFHEDQPVAKFSRALEKFQNNVVVLGNFDGLHCGHRALLAQAARESAPLAVLTFHPAPQAVLNPNNTKATIYPLRQKLELLAALGVAKVILISFSKKFANYSAEEFVANFLYQQLKPQTVMTGPDFCFGKGRQGNAATLTKYANKGCFKYIMATEEVLSDGQKCSSTTIRNLLRDGIIEEANKQLVSAYSIAGRVMRGKGLGRTLGVPTANIFLDPTIMLPKQGVYRVAVTLKDGRVLPGVANLGTNPTTDCASQKTLFEVHIFDFAEIIYGDRLHVSLLEYMRGEENFPDLNALQSAMQKDISYAKSRSHG